MQEKQITILMVDDDADDREFFSQAVSKLGSAFTSRFAINGIDALFLLGDENNHPDFIFLDLNMPLMSGNECLMAIRKEERLKHIPVIIYSTTTYGPDKHATLAMGANYFFSKPCNLTNLSVDILHTMKSVQLA